MEIRAFISDVLKAVVDGVVDAQMATKSSGAVISPARSREFSIPTDLSGAGGDIQTIDFEIAITATKPERGKGEAHPTVWAATSDEVGRPSSSRALSRLKFRVPVALPVQRSPKK